MNARRFFAWAGTVSAAVAAGPAGAGPESANLQFRLEEGRTVRYAYRLDSVDSKQPGLAPSDDVDIEADLAIRLVERDLIATRATVTFERIAVSIRPTIGESMQFDTASDPALDEGNALAPALRPMVGSRVAVTLAADGAITRLEPDPMLVHPGHPSATFAAALLEPDTFKRKMGLLFTTGRADDRAEVGTTWIVDERLAIEPGMDLLFSTEHRLASHERGVATVTYTSRLALEGGAAPGEDGTSLREGRIEGRYEWDTAAGILRRASDRQHIVLDVRAGPDTIPIGLDFELEIEIQK